MSEEQKAVLGDLLATYPGATLHHDDAISADAEAHDIAVALGCTIVIHPPRSRGNGQFKTAEKETPSARPIRLQTVTPKPRMGRRVAASVELRKDALNDYERLHLQSVAAAAPSTST
jgi:hypothetical protein